MAKQLETHYCAACKTNRFHYVQHSKLLNAALMIISIGLYDPARKYRCGICQHQFIKPSEWNWHHWF